MVWVDGHSDYGHAFEVFWERYGKDIGPKTTVLLLGDARNNYHASQAWVVKEIRQKARHVYWLNPEPQSLLGHRRLDRRRVRHAHATASTSAATCASSKAFVEKLE